MNIKLKVKQWLPFSLLITPTMAEMTFNAKNLPTPWPIAIISVLISAIGIFRYEERRVSLNILTKKALSYTVIRSLIALLDNWVSVANHGISNASYPVLSVLTSLSILPILDSLYDWEKDRFYSENNDNQEQQEYELEEIITTNEETTSSNITGSNNCLTEKRFKFLRSVFVGFATINLL